MPESSSIARAVIAVLAIVAVSLFGRAAYVTMQQQQVRDALWDELQPVPLLACEMARVGRGLDGGYPVCINLFDQVGAVYSYGIAGEDSAGCDVSERFGIEVHQYDCFDTREVDCPDAQPFFHAECVGPIEETIDGRPFDSVANQIAKTGHAGEHVFVKMDIDGGEITSLLGTPPETLALIDQLVIEIHGVSNPEILEMVRYLKKSFHLADLHVNNYSCDDDHSPFPGAVVEGLFVNKAIDQVDPNGTLVLPNPAWAVNNPDRPDCQVAH